MNKKLVSTVLATIIGMTSFPITPKIIEPDINASAISKKAPILGDLNNDEIVDVFDLGLMKRYIVSGADNMIDTVNADINLDGSVNVDDARLLQYYLLGKESPPVSTRQNMAGEEFFSESINSENDALKALTENRQVLGLDDKNISFKLERSDNVNGCDFYHYGLYYRGIPVYGKEIVINSNSAGQPYALVGNCELINQNFASANYSAEEAISAVNTDLSENVIKEAELYIYPKEDEYILAYVCSGSGYHVVINAETLEVIVENSIEMNYSTILKGQNNGDQTIEINDIAADGSNVAGSFFDANRNIYVLKESSNQLYQYTLSDYNNDITTSKKSTRAYAAVDLMSNATRCYDYFKDLGYVTNKGTMIVPQYLPAKKGGGATSNVDGSTALIGTYTNSNTGLDYAAYLDVVAHEYAHNVTNAIAFGNDGYSKEERRWEANALKEAYSDIFGELIELQVTGKNDWIIGPQKECVRNIAEPSKSKEGKKHPQKYDHIHKMGWVAKNEWLADKLNVLSDYAHANSTIISHAAYNMYKGYDGTSLTDEELGSIWFTSLQYLTNDSTMHDCANAVIRSAELLLKDENKINVVKNAFSDSGIYTSMYKGIIGSNTGENIYSSKNCKIRILDGEQNIYNSSYKLVINQIADSNGKSTIKNISTRTEIIVDKSEIVDGYYDYTFPSNGSYFVTVTPMSDTLEGSGVQSIIIGDYIDNRNITIGTNFTPDLTLFYYTDMGGDYIQVYRFQDKAMNETVTSLDIPGTINNKPVQVYFQAFTDCPNLTEVTLHEGMIRTGGSSFSGCEKLEKVNLPDSLKILDENTFKNCYALKDVNLPSTLETIGECAFENCSSLETIDIPKSVTQINAWAFSNCSSLSEIILPDNLKIIGQGAFANCTGINKITIPKLVEEITYPFSGCSSLNSIIFEGDLTSVKYLFGTMGTIKQSIYIELPDGFTQVEAYSFNNYDNLTIYIPPTVTSINYLAFLSSNVTINCKSGSHVEQYAKNNNIAFKIVS